MLCALNFVAVAEATQLALDAGVDAAMIPIALKGGRADSAILQEFMPKMAAKDYAPIVDFPHPATPITTTTEHRSNRTRKTAIDIQNVSIDKA